MKKSWKIILWITAVAATGAISAAAFGIYCNYTINKCERFCYQDIADLPEEETGLLPGTAKSTANGVPNLFFLARVEAAAELFHAGKIRHILISGDNSRKDYDEPTDMKNELIARGVPESAITLDYAGFRTLDSVVRAKNVFNKQKFTVITQPGQAERAIYIARKHGIEAIGFYAREPLGHPWVVTRYRQREKCACIAAYIDVNILHRKPKFEK